MAKTYLSGERIQGSSTGAKTTAEFEETFSGTGHTSDGTTVNGWTANDVSVLRYEGMSGTGLTGVANFDGDDKVTLGGSASDYNFLTTGFSIAFWVKPDAIANNNTVFDNTNGSASANGLVIRWEDSEKKIRLMIGSSGSGGGSCLSDGNEMELHEWQHLAFTYDGTTARIYRNGTEIKNAAITSHTGTAANVPAIGDCVSGGDSGYDGAIQDFVITNDTLTTGEITSLTNGSVASANLNNQKIHYPLTANFNDSSGGLGNGTASGNAAISTTTKGKQGDNLHFNITNITAASSGQELSYDLQHADALNGNNANATKWTLRFKLNMVTKSGTGQNGIQFSMGLSSHTANVARDFMGILILQSHQSAGNRVVNGTVNNNYPQNQGTSSNYLGGSSQTIELTSGSDWWVDITRDGDDCTTTIYTDEFSGTSYTLTKTVTSIADLRYLVFQNASGEATFVGSVDDIQFYDGGMTQDDKSTITNVPDGTRYEETDTRKIFRREIGALDNTTGLRFHYKFDEASGNVINYGSVASADLTVSGLTRDVSTPSGLGNGMSTPNRNSNDYAENTSRVNDYKFMHDGTAKWSVTFWAYLTEVPRSGANTEHGCMGNVWTDDAGIGWTVRWAMDQSPSSTTSCRIQTFIAESNTTGSSTMPLNDQSPNGMMPELNAWHFYCVTYDPTLSSNHLTVSRDAATSGTGFHQGSEDNDTYSSSNPTREVTYFARATSSHDLGMGGRLAEVTIWEDKILTQAEKVALYSSGNGTTKLASSWKEKGTA